MDNRKIARCFAYRVCRGAVQILIHEQKLHVQNRTEFMCQTKLQIYKTHTAGASYYIGKLVL